MYRGKDLGSRDELLATCRELLATGSTESLYSVLPHISILRCPSFIDPLSSLLFSQTRRKQVFAAMALGAVAHPRGLEPLIDKFGEPSTWKGTRCRSLQTAIIVAIGEIGSEKGLPCLKEILLSPPRNDGFDRKRRRLAVASVGMLLQRDIEEAGRLLLRLLDHKEEGIRAQAALELGTGYWHCPGQVPEEVLAALAAARKDPSREVRMAAFSATYGLARVGCQRAQEQIEN